MSLLFEKIIALLLSLAMSVTGVASVKTATETNEPEEDSISVTSYDEAVTALQGKALVKDDVYPTIIIHGIGQANTYLTDDDGNRETDLQGKEITGWPLYFNVPELVVKLIYPLMRTLITQKDNGLCDLLYDAVYDAMQLNAYDDDANPKYNMQVEQYDNRPVSQCTQEEKDHIYGCVPLQEYGEAVGEENLYYFAYNSFGDTFDIVDDLEEMIEQAKKDTGKDKVNLVPISLGGAISEVYFEENPEGENINKVVFIVPALDGSEIVGKLMAGELDYSNAGLYQDMFTKLVGVDNYTGWLINVAIRILPKQEVKDVLSSLALAISDSVLSKSINMWGLVPNSMYNDLADKYLTDGTVLREKADDFHEAQSNVVDNLKHYEENGIGVYDICGYGLRLYSLIDSDSNSDKIIHSASTSIGATFSGVGETLGDDYVQQYYTDYDMISPDGMVDASTCAFPMTTWFFGNQDHEKIARNDVVVRLAETILIMKDMDITSTPEYPQFNSRRDSRELKNMLLDAQAVDMTTLSAENAAQLQDAITATETVLGKTVIVEGELEAAQEQLETALVAIGVYEAPNDTLDNILLKVCKALSDFLYKFFGPRGFSDPVSAICE